MAAGRSGASGRGSGASRVPDDAWPCPCGAANAPESRSCARCDRARLVEPGGHGRRAADMGFARPARSHPSSAPPRSARSRPASRFEADRAALARYAAPPPPPRERSRSRAPPGMLSAPGTRDPASPSPSRRASRRSTGGGGGGGGGGAWRVAPTDPARPRERARERTAADAADPPPPPEAETISEQKSPSPPPPSACSSCGLDLDAQPDVPLPPDPDGERDPSVVGRWRGRCAEGHPVGFCGTCLLRDLSDVLCAARKRLEETVTGLGTAYVFVAEEEEEGEEEEEREGGEALVLAPAFDPSSPTLPCAKCAAWLEDVPLDEADADTYKQWSRAVSEAAFARTLQAAYADAARAREAEAETERAVEPSAQGGVLESPVVTAACPNRSCGAPTSFPRGGRPAPAKNATLVPHRDPHTGRWLSRPALEHRHRKMFACGVCSVDFCADCLASPYHAGTPSCARAAAKRASPRCRYCAATTLDPGRHFFPANAGRLRGEAVAAGRGASARDLRSAAGKGGGGAKGEGVAPRADESPAEGLRTVANDSSPGRLESPGGADVAWCRSTAELRSVFALSASVCDAPACVRTLAEACTRTHACGHACGGVRGETTCLPCLRCGCADEFDDDAAAEVSSGVKFVEETRRGRRISAGDPTKRDAPAPGDENRAPAGGGTGSGSGDATGEASLGTPGKTDAKKEKNGKDGTGANANANANANAEEDASALSRALDAALMPRPASRGPPRRNPLGAHLPPLPAHFDPCPACEGTPPLPLSAKPCAMLACGHVVHFACAVARVERGWQTQNATFSHLACPACARAPAANTAANARPPPPPQGGGESESESDFPKGSSDSFSASARLASSFAGAVMTHPRLASVLAEPLSFRERVMRKARRRLALDALGPPFELKAGGAFENRPGEYALTRLNYYRCEGCGEPYFGGDRAAHKNPGAGGGVARGSGEFEAPTETHRLLCANCSETTPAKTCKRGKSAPGDGHGASPTEEMEYKCRYCCSVAVWCCDLERELGGRTHFCDQCHVRWVKDEGGVQELWTYDPPKKTCNKRSCPLRVDHPEHGKEFNLGCALCRLSKDFYAQGDDE